MSSKFKEVVIVCGIRTPIGTYKGSLKKWDWINWLYSHKRGFKKSKFSEDEIDEVNGSSIKTAAGQNPARQAAVNAGIPVSKPLFN